MRRIILTLLANVAFSFIITAQGLLIEKASAPPVIDGIIDSKDPWQSDKWTLLTKGLNTNSNLGTKSEFQLMWDDQNLYFAVRVNDASRYNNNDNITKNDYVAFFLVMDTLTTDKYCRSNGKWQMYLLAKEGAKINWINIPPTSSKYSCKDNGTGYVQEWQLPWNELCANMSKPWNGKNLKIDVQTADNRENGAHQVQYWNDSLSILQQCAKYHGLVTLNDPSDSRKLQYFRVNQTNLPIKISNLCPDYPFFIYTNSGLPVQLESSNKNIATIIGEKIHPVSQGTCVITAKQDGNNEYKPAPDISFQLTVNNTDCVQPDMIIRKLQYSPVIDGIEDNIWKEVEWVNMEQHKGEVQNKNNLAKFKMSYDEKFLYVIVNVQDATIDTSQSRNVWEKDCVELYFSMDTNVFRNCNIEYGYNQFRKVYGREMIYNTNYSIAKEEITNGGYTQEWKFEWDTLTSKMSPYLARFDKKNFRFEITNSDNDGLGRNSQLFWHSNEDVAWCTNRHHGLVALSPEYLDIQSTKIKNPVNIWPNPTKNNLNVKSSSTILKVDIYSFNGQLINHYPKQGTEININITHIQQGLYILKVYTEKGVINEKLRVIK